jgi:pimeloyl-ACP methyl ester carboxylesterase
MQDCERMTIIAVHGNGGGGFRFSRLQPYLPDAVNLVAPTLPGFSDTPAAPHLTNLGAYADWMVDVVSNTAPPRIFLGHGIGGTILLEFAQRHSKLADGFIFHAPVGSSLNTRFFPTLMKIPMATHLGQFLFSEPLLRPLFRSLLFSSAVPIQFSDRFFDEYRACSVFDQMFRIITPEWFASLKPIATPSVLLWGAKDHAIRVDELKHFMPILVNSSTKVIDSWAHFPMIEQPQEYAREIIAIAESLVAGQAKKS